MNEEMYLLYVCMYVYIIYIFKANVFKSFQVQSSCGNIKV